jgi:hypothetical protein
VNSLEKESVVIQAVVTKATTTVDGGWRFTFETDETQGTQIIELMKLKHEIVNLIIVRSSENGASRWSTN